MRNFSIKQSLLVLAIFFLLVFINPLNARPIIYGKIHLSSDYVDTGAFEGHGLSSNASRIGFKGVQKIDDKLKVIWKIESEVDLTDSDTIFASRNRYLGLNYTKSTLIAGFHDTPFKTLGAKMDVMNNSIADRRAILGLDNITVSQFDVRAENVIMYINKSFESVEIRLMRSAGETNATVGDITPLSSMSIRYKTSKFQIAAAVENKEVQQVSGLRIMMGASIRSNRFKVIYEKLDLRDANTLPGWNRSAFGANWVYKTGPISYRAQAFIALNRNASSDTSGRLYSVGIFRKIAKQLELYAILARLENDKNSAYSLTAAGHGQKYRPSANGANMHGLSAGITFKF